MQQHDMNHVTTRQPGSDFCAAVASAAASGDFADLSTDLIRNVLSAALRAYSAKAYDLGEEFMPLESDISATEALVTICAIMRATNVNLLDLAMWHKGAAPQGSA